MSTYTDFLAKPTSAKQTLIELDLGEDSIFVNEGPGVWSTTYSVDEDDTAFDFGSGTFGFGSFGSAGTADLGNSNSRYKVGSVWVDGEYFAQRTSLSDVRSNERSFYFDAANSMLYVSFDGFDPPWSFDFIQIGVTRGYASRSAYLDDVYYDGRLKAVPTISKRKDPLFFGAIRFEGGEVELLNADGELDDLALLDVFGQACRIKFGSTSMNYFDLETVYEGYVEEISYKGDSVAISVQDKRKSLSREIPASYFDSDDYPNMSSRNIGKPIPIGYGTIVNAPVLCTNQDGSAPFSFKIVDTSEHAIGAISQVYVEGAEVNHGDEDLTNATFSLSAGVYTAGDDVTVDFSGYVDSGGSAIENALDVVKDLMSIYAGVSYDSVNYDTTEWVSETTGAPSIGLFVDDSEKLIDVIGDICVSVPGIFLVQDDGKYTFKTYDSSKSPDRTIEIGELLQPPAVSYDSEEFLSSVLIKYSRDWAEDEFLTYIDDDEEDSIFETYKTRRQKTFETLLTSASAAASYGSTIMDISGEIKPVFVVMTKTQNVDLELEDVVDLEVYKVTGNTYGTVRCEVLGIERDLLRYTVTLTLRYIKSITADLNLATLIRWRSGKGYSTGDVTTYGGNLWRAVSPSGGETPSFSSEFWEAFASITWQSTVTYDANDVVNYEGTIYRALRETIGDQPDTSADDWEEYTVSGSAVTIADSGGYYDGTEVETILQEVGADLAAATLESYDTGWINRSDWTNVHPGSDDTKNADSNVAHNLNASLSELLVKFLISTDGTDANSFEIVETNNVFSSGIGGYQIHQVDSNNIYVVTGAQGLTYITGGTLAVLDTEDWYYKVKVWKLG